MDAIKRKGRAMFAPALEKKVVNNGMSSDAVKAKTVEAEQMIGVCETRLVELKVVFDTWATELLHGHKPVE